MHHKELERGEAGDNMGALLRGIKREQIHRGQAIIAPGSMKSIKKFVASLYVLSKDEGAFLHTLYPCSCLLSTPRSL